MAIATTNTHQQQGIGVVHSPFPASCCCHLIPFPPHSPPLFLLRRNLKIEFLKSAAVAHALSQHIMEYKPNLQ
jgi:hypothetical protein